MEWVPHYMRLVREMMLFWQFEFKFHRSVVAWGVVFIWGHTVLGQPSFVCFKLNFTETSFSTILYSFKIHNPVCTPVKPLPRQDRGYCYHPPKFLLLPILPILLSPHLDPFNTELPFCHRLFVLFCFAFFRLLYKYNSCLVSYTQHNDFDIHSFCYAC